MILKKSLLTVLITGAMIAATTVSANDKVSRGAILAASCFGCHGTDGKSRGSIPSINKKSAKEIETAMTEFKSGGGTIMVRHAKGYSEADIREIARYISGNK